MIRTDIQCKAEDPTENQAQSNVGQSNGKYQRDLRFVCPLSGVDGQLRLRKHYAHSRVGGDNQKRARI
jgi:hypothetical protein